VKTARPKTPTQPDPSAAPLPTDIVELRKRLGELAERLHPGGWGAISVMVLAPDGRMLDMVCETNAR
jgi:hypothetical protein